MKGEDPPANGLVLLAHVAFVEGVGFGCAKGEEFENAAAAVPSKGLFEGCRGAGDCAMLEEGVNG